MRIDTRPLKQSDFSEVEELFAESFPRIPRSDLRISWNDRSKEDSVGMFITDDREARDILIGFVIASYHPNSGRSMYVDYFALAKEYRGSGIGTNFLLQLVTDCYDKKGSIHLYPERVDLIPWYERNGFRKTHGGYYVFHSYTTRARHRIHMELGLASDP
jgi:GNAT superfamily N-acetyltransferase